jgi:hypothetical protein
MAILIIAITFFLGFQLNELLFAELEYHRGAHWIFLPAGLRLLFVLVFGVRGIAGIFLGSALVRMNAEQALTFNILIESGISVVALLLIYQLALWRALDPSLSNLRWQSLLTLSVGFGATSAFMHLLWLASTGVATSFLESFFAMLVGDVAGTVLLIYIAKVVLAVMRRFNAGPRRPDQD